MNTLAPPPTKTQTAGSRLKVLEKTISGVPFVEGLAIAKSANMKIASNLTLGHALICCTEKTDREPFSSFWTGTLAAYVRPGATFNTAVTTVNEAEKYAGTRYFVSYQDPHTRKRWLFPVPPEFLCMKNSILVAEHPDYRLVSSGNDVIILPQGKGLRQAIDLVERFPGTDGFYPCDAVHGIPSGDPLRSFSLGAGRLWRIGAMVGPVSRGFKFGADGCAVGLNFRPSFEFRMFVETTAREEGLNPPPAQSP
jgi:hypothetical protein